MDINFLGIYFCIRFEFPADSVPRLQFCRYVLVVAKKPVVVQVASWLNAQIRLKLKIPAECHRNGHPIVGSTLTYIAISYNLLIPFLEYSKMAFFIEAHFLNWNKRELNSPSSLGCTLVLNLTISKAIGLV